MILLQEYRLRLQLSLISVLLVLIGIAQWWPLPSAVPPDDIVYHTSGQEMISLEEIQPTRQQGKPPPPPLPPVPILVPDDVLIEDQIYFEDARLSIDTYENAVGLADALPAGEAASAPAPEIGPKPLRFVEPEYTRAARRRNVRAEVIVEVLVDTSGGVQEARIVERFLYGEGDEKDVVSSLGYGLEEAALDAARRWIFQPARKGGQPVQSYTTLTFSFGI